MNNCGIYRIDIGPYYYFGSSVDLPRRKQQHIAHLTGGYHFNHRAQRAYNKYKDFSFNIVQICSKDSLLEAEQSWLNIHFGLPDCMNLSKVAGRCSVSEEDLKRRAKTLKDTHALNPQWRIDNAARMAEGRKNPKTHELQKVRGRERWQRSEYRDKFTGRNHPRVRVHRWFHPEHGELILSVPELIAQFNYKPYMNAKLSQLVNGSFKQYKNWVILELDLPK